MLAYLRGGQGTPLIALHGNFASKAWFARMLEQPPRGVEVLAPDMPGFGDSASQGRDRPTIEFFADAVESWMAALKLERPFLLGHSLGGAVAMEMAARQPAAFRGLILVSSCGLNGFKTPFLHYAVMRRYKHDRTLLRRSLSLLLPKAVPMELLLDEAQRMHSGGFTGNAKALAHWSVAERVERLRKVPTLLLGGERDPIIRPSEIHKTAKQLPHAQVRIEPGISHAWMLEAPQQFVEAVGRFTER